MIKVDKLYKSFGDLSVLENITENIDQGEKVVIIGPSGSGKSTFLRCLNLMERPAPKNRNGFSTFQFVSPSDNT